MHEFETARQYRQSPERVWALIGDFGDLQTWLPGVRDCVIEENDGGVERIVTPLEGGAVRERLLGHDDAARWYRYGIIEAPGFPPDMHFEATLAVLSEESGSRVVWSARFAVPGDDSGRIAGRIRQKGVGMYEACLAHLQTVLDSD